MMEPAVTNVYFSSTVLRYRPVCVPRDTHFDNPLTGKCACQDGEGTDGVI